MSIYMSIQKRLEKRINAIASTTGEYSREIEITKREFEQLAEELGDDIPLNQFRWAKLKIID